MSSYLKTNINIETTQNTNLFNPNKILCYFINHKSSVAKCEGELISHYTISDETYIQKKLYYYNYILINISICLVCHAKMPSTVYILYKFSIEAKYTS